MTSVVGVDGCKKGWIAIELADGRFRSARTYQSMTDLLDDHSTASAIGVDMPIGLLDQARRLADVEAKRFVGARRSSVFLTPGRPVMEAATYDEARNISTDRYGIGVSSQAYRGLRAKVLELDDLDDQRIIEVHPEVSFRALAGCDLSHHKRTWQGQATRRRLLADAGIDLPDDLGAAGAVPVDDVLDAAVVAWSAHRHADGTARSLPDPPEIDDRGRPVAIWY